MSKVSVANDYIRTPGARYIKDGEFSGEDFRNKILEPLFLDETDRSKIVIDLDGTDGYATSFLEEAFGGLARIFGKKVVLARLSFISNEEPELIEEILGYINAVSKE